MKAKICLLAIAGLFLACCLSCTSEAYVTLDGLWKCTPETALGFEVHTLETVIFIKIPMVIDQIVPLFE